MNLGLEKKVALVTGSSQGIGFAVARQLACDGACVAITYRNEHKRAGQLAEDIQAGGGEAIALQMDLSSFDSITRTRDRVIARWGRLDILVNNAMQWGPTRFAQAPPFEELPLEEWQLLLQANIGGPFRLIQSVVPAMRTRGWGRIVNVSSISAEDGLVRGAWYATAKASLHGLTRSLSRELGPDGILVNAVMPGLTNTERMQYISPEARSRVEASVPIRRILEPEEVASIVVFLCSEKNTALTGEILRASGGRA